MGLQVLYFETISLATYTLLVYNSLVWQSKKLFFVRQKNFCSFYCNKNRWQSTKKFCVSIFTWILINLVAINQLVHKLHFPKNKSLVYNWITFERKTCMGGQPFVKRILLLKNSKLFFNDLYYSLNINYRNLANFR